MMVDGDAALALAEIARRALGARHRRAGSARASVGIDPGRNRRAPDFTRQRNRDRAHAARCDGDQQEVREVETLFHDMIAHAERSIYIENQFVTSRDHSRRRWRSACARGRELEVVIVAPRAPRVPGSKATRCATGASVSRGFCAKPASASACGCSIPRCSDGEHVDRHHGAFQGDDHRRSAGCASARPT